MIGLDAEICRAIKERRVVNLTYGGKLRQVEPYCYGISKTDKAVLRAYQLCEIGLDVVVGWRLFAIAKISGFALTDDHFDGVRPEYSPRDREMSRVICCV